MTPTFKKKTQKAKSSGITADPTANWIAYASSDSKVSLKYPKTWVTATHPELCSTGVLLLGSDSNSVGKCGSEDFGQVSVTWQPAHATCGDLSSDNTTVNAKENVTVSGVSGLKQTTTVKAGGEPQLGNPPVGAKSVNYCFNTGGYTYVANYTKLSTYPDALTDFNLMVTKTLKFD